MLTAVADRALNDLRLIQAVLSGEMPADHLPPVVPEASCEVAHRNAVAQIMVGRLGTMFFRMTDVAGELENVVLALAGNPRPVPLPVVEEDKPAFGFGAVRRAA